MTAGKLRVDLTNGVLEVEGSEDFVREMHAAFHTHIGDLSLAKQTVKATLATAPANENRDDPKPATEQKSRPDPTPRRRKPTREVGTAARKPPYEPRVLTDVNYSTDLPRFYQQYAPKVHSDKIAVFCMYLRHVRGITVFSANHIFTCYRVTKEKPPKAFKQALYDARGQDHFIKFENFEEIELTHIGETHVEHDVPKKAVAE